MNDDGRQRAERRYDLDRTTAFSDGVFAIAITLIVLSLEPPPKINGSFSHQLHQVFGGTQGHEWFAYFLSFAVIGRFWLGHHRMFGYLIHVDGVMTTLNLGYLAFIVLTPFSTDVLGDNGAESSLPVMIYAANLAIVGMLASLMWAHAMRAGLIDKERAADVTESVRLTLLIGPWVVFVASIPVALLSPTVAELMWLLLFFMRPQIIGKLGVRSAPH